MFPVHYFDLDGQPIQGAAGSAAVFDLAACRESGLEPETLRRAIKHLAGLGMSVTRVFDPYPGQVARVQIDVYGESAAEVEATLLAYAERAGAGLQASACPYGRCVIERNLEEEWGATYSWRGRLTLNPTIGMIPSSKRAAAAMHDTGDGSVG